MRSTRQISRVNNATRKEPSAKNTAGLSRSNTMTGLPGYINAHAREGMGYAKGEGAAGPRREGDIGRKGGSTKIYGKKDVGGTMVKDYRSSSTGKPGAVKSNMAKTPHLHTANRGSGRSVKGPPTSHGKVPGGGKSAGIGASHSGAVRVGGSKGTMESLSGKARTSSEGRRRSMMY